MLEILWAFAAYSATILEYQTSILYSALHSLAINFLQNHLN